MLNKDKARSSFVSKLHDLLSAEQHPEYLHWVNSDTFAITSTDAHARIALAPQWDFRTLSAFIRQLSYYSFKRLSDRRRSAERRSSVAWIVFTHPSGNFIREDPSKTAMIPRKLRARKPATKRKNSSASGTSVDRSPTPPDALRFETVGGDEHKMTEVQLGLQSYQVAPWNAIDQGRTIRSPHRPVPPHVPDHLQFAPHPSVREQGHVYDVEASGYPSPLSAPASSNLFPISAYYPPHASVQQPLQQGEYYYAASSSAPAPVSPFSTFANNELPPLRALTSGLVAAPPSPPHEPHYQHYQPRADYNQRRAHPVEEERTPSPVSAYSHIPPPQPVALPSVAQLDPQQFYPPSPPKYHNAYFASSHPHATPHAHLSQIPSSYGSATHHTHEAAKSAFYHLSGQDGIDYGSSPGMAHA